MLKVNTDALFLGTQGAWYFPALLTEGAMFVWPCVQTRMRSGIWRFKAIHLLRRATTDEADLVSASRQCRADSFVCSLVISSSAVVFV